MEIITSLNENNGLITALATVILAIITGWYAWLTRKMLKANENSNNELIRPYIFVNIFSQDLFINLTIANIGKRPAYDLKISFDPSLSLIEQSDPQNQSNEHSYFKAFDHSPLLNQKIMPPGHSLNTVLAYNTLYLKNTDLPRVFQAKYEYHDKDNKVYEEFCTFDLSSQIYSKKTIKFSKNYLLSEIIKELKVIANNIKSKE